MKSRDVIRMLLWGLLFLISVVFGIYGMLLSRNSKPDPVINTPVTPAQTTAEYLRVEDLINQKKSILSGNLNFSKGNIKLHLNGTESAIITISEKPNLTINSYNSFISLLTIMYNDQNIVNYFKNNYQSLTTGNKTFNGFQIEINPSLNEDELTIFNLNDSIVRISIIKAQINL